MQEVQNVHGSCFWSDWVVTSCVRWPRAASSKTKKEREISYEDRQVLVARLANITLCQAYHHVDGLAMTYAPLMRSCLALPAVVRQNYA